MPNGPDRNDLFVDFRRGILGLEAQGWWVPQMQCALTQGFEWARENAWAYPPPPGTGAVLAYVDGPLFNGGTTGRLWWHRSPDPGATDSATDGYLQGNVRRWYSGRNLAESGFRDVGVLNIMMRAMDRPISWEKPAGGSDRVGLSLFMDAPASPFSYGEFRRRLRWHDVDGRRPQPPAIRRRARRSLQGSPSVLLYALTDASASACQGRGAFPRGIRASPGAHAHAWPKRLPACDHQSELAPLPQQRATGFSG